MASSNPFDILEGNDNDDPAVLAAAQPKPAPAVAAAKAGVGKLPTKPLPPAQAVKEASKDGLGRGGGRESGRGGRGPGYNRDGGAREGGYYREGGGRGPRYNREGGGRDGGYDREGGARDSGYDREGRGRGPRYDREGRNRGPGYNGGSYNGGSFEKPTGGEDDVQRSSGGSRSYADRGSYSDRGSYVDRPREPYRGGQRGGFNNAETGDGEGQTRRQYERRSGTGRGNEFKREGSGRGNWGTPSDEVMPEGEQAPNGNENVTSPVKQPGEEEDTSANKENPEKGVANKEDAEKGTEENKPEEKEMTLEEYEKVLEEKKKALQVQKTDERKVTLDKDLKSMRQLSNKKDNVGDFIKLGSDKDRRKEVADKEERVKKAVSINEFLKPAEGEAYYGRGRGRGGRGGFRGGSSAGRVGNNLSAPSITDEGQFPTLGA